MRLHILSLFHYFYLYEGTSPQTAKPSKGIFEGITASSSSDKKFTVNTKLGERKEEVKVGDDEKVDKEVKKKTSSFLNNNSNSSSNTAPMNALWRVDPGRRNVFLAITMYFYYLRKNKEGLLGSVLVKQELNIRVGENM